MLFWTINCSNYTVVQNFYSCPEQHESVKNVYVVRSIMKIIQRWMETQGYRS